MDQEFWNESYIEDAAQPAVQDYFLADETAGLKPGSALDLGCGTGNIALMLAEKGWTVTGVDWAEHAVKLANNEARKRGLQAAFFTADITTWTAPQQYDLVYSTFAMPAGAAMKAAVATMTAALKPGGTLIVCEWNQKMIPIWGFNEDDLHSIDSYLAAMPELEIKTAETRHVTNAFADDQMRGDNTPDAYITFIRAVAS